jgi:uncharacterized protein RhaS with RHS repeats
LDADTGLYYYGYRYYDSVTGRWPSRDPIEERGGLNICEFASNSGIHRFDILGKEDCVAPQIKDGKCLEIAKNNYDGALEKNDNNHKLAIETANTNYNTRARTIMTTFGACLGYCSYLLWTGAPYGACIASCSIVGAGAAIANAITFQGDIFNADAAKKTADDNALVDYNTSVKNCGCVCPKKLT